MQGWLIARPMAPERMVPSCTAVEAAANIRASA
jgi:hypothetical protein